MAPSCRNARITRERPTSLLAAAQVATERIETLVHRRRLGRSGDSGSPALPLRLDEAGVGRASRDASRPPAGSSAARRSARSRSPCPARRGSRSPGGGSGRRARRRRRFSESGKRERARPAGRGRSSSRDGLDDGQPRAVGSSSSVNSTSPSSSHSNASRRSGSTSVTVACAPRRSTSGSSRLRRAQVELDVVREPVGRAVPDR